MDIKDNGEKNRVFFNNKIDSYDTTHEVFMETKKALTVNLPEDTTKILDLGAGTGLELIRKSRCLAKRQRLFYGLRAMGAL